MKLIIPGRCISWNAIYSANNYYVRKIYADQIHIAVHAVLLQLGYRAQKKANYFTKKVDIKVIACFAENKHAIDSDNIPAKLYIDGLKSFLLADDRIQYVGKVETETILAPGKDRVEIEIIERR